MKGKKTQSDVNETRGAIVNTPKSDLKSAIETDVDLFKYLTSKGASHNHYKHYSNIEVINKIVEDRCLYLTRGENWNDLRDRLSFHKMSEDRIRFGICLSYSASENIAMWMLYGGLEKRGALIDLTKKDASFILSKSEFEAGYRDEERNFHCTALLTKDEGCDLYFTDILYCGKNDDESFSAKRSDERVDGLMALPQQSRVLEKEYPWCYENEVRLVLEAPAELISDNIECIKIPLLRTSEQLKEVVRLAPNSEVRGTGYNRSKLKGELDWDICKYCSLKK